MHISCVRGSPLIRTVLVLLALVVSGVGFARLTLAQKVIVLPGTDSRFIANNTETRIPARVYLTFSERVSELELIQGDKRISKSKRLTDGKKGDWWDWDGELSINPAKPVLFLKIGWESIEKGHRFAKLVVEAEGQETFTHFFEAEGDIDDFVELPF